MSDETNPTQADEANPVVPAEANPDTGSQPQDSTAPVAAPEAESPTPEQIEEWRKGYEANTNTQAEYTRGQQALRSAEQERDRYAEAHSVLVGREQQRVDPLVAIDARMEEAYDPDVRRQLMQQRDALIIQRAEDGAVNKALNAFDARNALGGADPNELARLEQSMTPAQRVAMLRREQAVQNGTLYDDLTAERQAKETAAANAARLNAPLGEGAAPGMYSGGAQQTENRINDISFLMLPKKKQGELIEAGYKVFNNRTGEEIPL